MTRASGTGRLRPGPNSEFGKNPSNLHKEEPEACEMAVEGKNNPCRATGPPPLERP